MKPREKAQYKILLQTWKDYSRDATKVSAMAGYDPEDEWRESLAWDAEQAAYDDLMEFITTHDLEGTEYDVARDGWD